MPSIPPSADEPGALTTLHVQRAQAGDRESLEWIVERLAPLLVAEARHRLGDLAEQYDPQDIVHDAWVVALPRLADLTAREQRLTPVLLRFLSTAIVNRVRNLLHARARRGDVERLPEITAEQSGAVSRAIRGEHAEALYGAIAGLDPLDREILLLRGVEQVSAKAAALVTGISVDAVNKRFQRSLVRLRALLPGSVIEEIDA